MASISKTASVLEGFTLGFDSEESAQYLSGGGYEYHSSGTGLGRVVGGAQAPLLEEGHGSRIQSQADVKPPEENVGHGSGFLEAGSMASSMWTLCAMSLGVGIFVLPNVVVTLGLIPGLGFMFLFAYWGYVAQLVLLEYAMNKYKTAAECSYAGVVADSLGTAGCFALSFFSALSCLIGNAGHMKVVVALLHTLMEFYITDDYGKIPVTSSRRTILYVGLLSIALFVSTGRRISSLRYVSTFSVLTVLTLSLWMSMECVVWYWPQGTTAFTGDNAIQLFATDWQEYAANIPAIAFAFSSTFCLFPVYREITNKQDIKKAVSHSTLMILGGYVLVATIGVATFGKTLDIDAFTGQPSQEYLYSFPPDHYVVTFLCFVLVVCITLLYGVINFPMVQGVLETMEILKVPSNVLQSTHTRNIITLLGMILVVLINNAFDDLTDVFGLCGAWGVGMVVYAVPSAVALTMDRSLSFKLVAFISLVASLVMAFAFTYTVVA
jgi:amino acid permease